MSIDDFRSRNLKGRRALDVYLPPGYAVRTEARYPVLYLNDANEVRAIPLERILSELYREGAIEHIIAVGLYPGADRFGEHGTAAIRNAQGKGGPKAAAYQRFITDEVVPYVRQHFRSRDDPAGRAIAGWSLGGLSAFDTAWNNPAVFGTVGAFSGSFWWRSDDRTNETQQSSRIAHRVVRASKKRDGLRFWFEAGTAEEAYDRDGNGVIDVIQDTTELMDELRALGYDERDMTYVEVPDGEHDVGTWAQVLPRFLVWAFPPQAP